MRGAEQVPLAHPSLADAQDKGCRSVLLGNLPLRVVRVVGCRERKLVGERPKTE